MEDNNNNNLEDQGPKQGVSIKDETVKSLFSKYLEKNVESIELTKLGYNNVVSFVKTDQQEEYVLKLCGRFWSKIKTETEVAAINLVDRYCNSIPVPTVSLWSSEKTPESDNQEYIVSKRMHGLVLKDLWEEENRLTKSQKLDIIRQLAEMVIELRTTHRRCQDSLILNKIGNLKITSNDSKGYQYQVDKDLSQNGPWENGLEFLRFYLTHQLSLVVENKRGVYSHHLPLIPRIKNAIEVVLKELCEKIAPEEHHRFYLTHGDLNFQNILVEEQAGEYKITGILDWEWFGSFPETTEWFLSFEFVREEGNDEEKELFLSLLESKGVGTPRTIPHFKLKQDIELFKESIAPWWLRDISNPESNESQEKMIESVKEFDQLLKLFNS
eukprot:gene9379-11521_t